VNLSGIRSALTGAPSFEMLSVQTTLGRIETVLASLAKGQADIMSQISDWAAKEATTLASIQSGITALDTMIQTLQGQASGNLSAADQAALQQIADTSAALAAAANTVPPPTPAP
jgi:hypothetical protein